MRKNHWISLAIALVIIGLFIGLEQRRHAYFNSPDIDYETIAPQGWRKFDFLLARRMQRAEWAGLDIRFQLRGDRPPHPDVAIIKIDELSLRELRAWPWPRRIHARLIETLAKAPPKALMFDIFFIEPFNSDLEGDALLAKATAKYPWVVHSLYFVLENNKITEFSPPYRKLLTSMHEAGSVNAQIDEDGVLRKALPDLKYEGQSFNLLSVVGASFYLGIPIEKLLATVHLDARGAMPVNFAGKEYTFPYYSYCDVLSGKIKPEVFQGKAVLVGSQATGTFDHYPTPLSKNMPGVEFHANVIDNLLRGNSLKEADIKWTYVAIAILGLFCGLLLARLSAWAGALWALCIGLGYAGCAQWFFITKNTVLDLAGPLLTLALAYGSVLVYRFFTEEREKQMVKSFFSQQVSGELLDVLMQDPGVLKKPGERREMSAFFSDVAGFTSISERLEPEELVSLLNEYLTAMTDVIFKHGGYVDKYMGDGIMAFWNGLLKQVDHAERACRCALESVKALETLNQGLVRRNLVPLKARIGVNTGVMAAGYMGSSQKKQYTIMGDNVNLASRLEGANKAFGTPIMISEFTYELVQDKFDVRFLDIIRVPGKAKPVKVYELLSEKGQLSESWRKSISIYHEAIQLFADRQFSMARMKFLEVGKNLGHDKACDVYLERADAFITQPPPKDWDGVFELKTK